MDLKVYKNKKYQPEETIKQKSAPVKNEPKKQVMYLIEKPPAKRANSNTRKELTYVSPKRIYMVDEKIEK